MMNYPRSTTKINSIFHKIQEYIKMFIEGSRYRGITSQIHYMLAGWINQNKFKRLNEGLEKNKIAITPQDIINIYPDDYYHWRYFTDIDVDMVREMQSFINVTQDKNCLIDIGASIGIFSLVFASRPHAQAWAIEPCQSAYKKLLDYQQLNPKCQLQPLQLAIGNTNGTLKMQYNQTNMLVVTDYTESNCDHTYEVDVLSLDQLVEQQKMIPDVIKIDVEGFELNILQGATKVLQNYSPIIFLEVHPMYLTKFQSSSLNPIQQITNLLADSNYQVYDYNLHLIKNPFSFLSKRIQRIICMKDSNLTFLTSQYANKL